MRGTSLCAVAASFGAAHFLFAQEISGTAHVAGADVPLGAVAVVLVNQNGVIVAGTLTAPDGRYRVRAPVTGQFRVRARRIGFSPDSTAEMTFDAGSQLHYDPSLTALRASLQVVRVEGIQKCEVGPESGQAAYDLWDAAQNALAATIAAAGDKLYTYRLRRFLREVDPDSKRVIHGNSATSRSLSSEPYHSADPDSLIKVGFVRSERDSTVFYAPDAKTLTSEVFLRTHCLRAVKDSSKPGQLGLAFEPVRRTAVADVSGALWLDRESSELRDIEYRYEMPDLYVRGRRIKRLGAVATGRIDYRRLESGAWIVDSWVIRVPIESSQSRQAGYARRGEDSNDSTVWEVGGNVAAVLGATDTARSADEILGAISGHLVAGSDRLPVIGAQVALIPANPLYEPWARRTMGDGVFSFDSLPPDKYVLRLATLEFDTLNITFPEIQFQVDPGTSTEITVTMPSPAEGRELLCKGGSDPKSIIVHGTVTDSTLGIPFPQARVAATWVEDVPSDKPLVAERAAREKEVTTDREGKFAFCDLKPNTKVIVGAVGGQLRSRSAIPITLVEGGIYMVNLRLAPAPQNPTNQNRP
jgi:hypothetical protein